MALSEMHRSRRTERRLLIETNLKKKNGGEGQKEWNIEDKIIEESVGDCREVGNYELGEEDQVNNDIAESQLGIPNTS